VRDYETGSVEEALDIMTDEDDADMEILTE
jgi:hypothetical protein